MGTRSGSTFGDVSAVESLGPGRWAATLAEGWDIVGNTNGGYLLAIIARAMAAESGRDPITITGHFLSPGRAGPVDIDTRVLKAGRTLTTVSATMTREERPVLAALGTLGPSPIGDDVLLRDANPVDLPDPQTLPRIRHNPEVGFPPPFMERVDLRLHPDDMQFSFGRPSGQPTMRGWFRLRDGEPIDAEALILAADSFPPTVFNLGGHIGWAPTVELTVHVRGLPAPGWLRMDFRTRFISHQRLEVDGLIWNEAGQLVAQSRQIALIPAKAGA